MTTTTLTSAGAQRASMTLDRYSHDDDRISTFMLDMADLAHELGIDLAFVTLMAIHTADHRRR